MRFETIAELRCDPASALVYEEGWQSWSTAAVYRGDGRAFEGRGVLAVTAPGRGGRAWFGPGRSIRAEAAADRLLVSADGPVEHVAAASLDAALASVGERLAVSALQRIPAGWSSWSCYFDEVTEADVAGNVEAADRLGLDIGIVQVDDGWQAAVGDWLDVSARFGSLAATADRIGASGRDAGVWTAPFLVHEHSRLARGRPGWLVGGADAGENWGGRLLVLDVTHPHAAEHLANVYRRLDELGFRFHKLDFLYAGALPGRRHGDVDPLDAYRAGLELIRDAAGGATLLGCGAPLLPSVGLVDAMRVGPDVIGREWHGAAGLASLAKARAIVAARAWMHGRLWTNDPDHLLARPGLPGRDPWCGFVADLGGLVFSGDRLAELDERGLEMTRRALPSAQ